MSADFIDLDQLAAILAGTEPDGPPPGEEDADEQIASFDDLEKWLVREWPKWTGQPYEQTWYHCQRCGFSDERFYAVFCTRCGKRL